MKRRSAIIALVLFPFLTALGQESKQQPAKPATPTATAPEAKPAAAPKVRLKTNKGDIVLQLDAAKAPATVANFLGYVKKKHYDGTVFHRVIEDFMIQGGGFAVEGTKLVEKTTGKPVANEGQNGLKNVRGSIAMARTANPDSATAQFFISVKDNAALDYPNNGGYAVFGKVISGMEVVDAIKAVRTGSKSLTMRHPQTGEKLEMPSGDVPEENVVILSATVE